MRDALMIYEWLYYFDKKIDKQIDTQNYKLANQINYAQNLILDLKL